MSLDQGVSSPLELAQCRLLGNALHRAHKLPSLLYTECLQSHKMLFFCFILLVSCEASLSRQMNHIVIGCNEFNYVISFFHNETKSYFTNRQSIVWSYSFKLEFGKKSTTEDRQVLVFFFSLCFYLPFTIWICPDMDHNYTYVLNRGDFMFTACGCWWRVNHSTTSSVDVMEPITESISCLEEAVQMAKQHHQNSPNVPSSGCSTFSTLYNPEMSGVFWV